MPPAPSKPAGPGRMRIQGLQPTGDAREVVGAGLGAGGDIPGRQQVDVAVEQFQARNGAEDRRIGVVDSRSQAANSCGTSAGSPRPDRSIMRTAAGSGGQKGRCRTHRYTSVSGTELIPFGSAMTSRSTPERTSAARMCWPEDWTQVRGDTATTATPRGRRCA